MIDIPKLRIKNWKKNSILCKFIHHTYPKCSLNTNTVFESFFVGVCVCVYVCMCVCLGLCDMCLCDVCKFVCVCLCFCLGICWYLYVYLCVMYALCVCCMYICVCGCEREKKVCVIWVSDVWVQLYAIPNVYWSMDNFQDLVFFYHTCYMWTATRFDLMSQSQDLTNTY